MDFDPDHYSKYALRRFAAVANILGLIAFAVVNLGHLYAY